MTAVLAVLAAGMIAVQVASAHAQGQVEKMTPRLKELEDAGLPAAQALHQTAEEWYKSASAWDKISVSMQNYGWLKNAGLIGGLFQLFRGGNQAVENFADITDDARKKMGEFAYQSAAATDSQKSLNDMLAEGVGANDDLGQAVADAADAQHKQNDVTATSKGLMEAYADSTYDAVDATLALFDKAFAARKAQRDYNSELSGYKDAIKEAAGNTDKHAEALDTLTKSALDTAAALAEQDRQNALNNGTFLTAGEVTEKQVGHLKDLRDEAVKAGMPQDVIDSLNTYITSLENAQNTASDGVTLETDVNLMTPDQIASKVAELKLSLRDAYQSGNQPLADSIQMELDKLTADKTVTVNTVTNYSPGGYNAVKARADYLAQNRTGAININTAIGPDGYNALKASKDYLAQNVTGTVDIHITFNPDGYNALKARKDYLAQDRTAYIDIVVRGAAQARSTLNGLAPATSGAGPAQYSATTPQTVTNHWSVTVNGATDPRAVVRALDRYARDNGRPSSVVVTV